MTVWWPYCCTISTLATLSNTIPKQLSSKIIVAVTKLGHTTSYIDHKL